MYFTQEDYRRIEQWLYNRTVKDTELKTTEDLNGSELIPIIQNSENKTMSLNNFIQCLSTMKLSNVYNITTSLNLQNITLETAIRSVPVLARKLGLIITFKSVDNNWLIFQFTGDSLMQWTNDSCWINIVHVAIKEYLAQADEEDITRVKQGSNWVYKFKDKEYNKDKFSGMGRIILRKNLKGTEACSVDDEDHYTNILSQNSFVRDNTIYIIQYDFDLDGKNIIIPSNCTLAFEGGSLNNGTITVDNTLIQGVANFKDVGTNITINKGSFRLGQIIEMESGENNQNKKGLFWNDGTDLSRDAWRLILTDKDLNNINTRFSKLIKDYIRRIATVNNRLTEVKKSFNSSISAINDLVSTLRTDVNRNKKEMARINTYITSTLKPLIDTNTKNIKSNLDKINANSSLIEQLIDKDSQINTLVIKIAEDVENLVKGLGTIDEVVQEHSSTIAQLGKFIQALGDKLRELEINISTNQINIRNLQERVNDIWNRIQEESNRINTLHNTTQNHETRITTLETLPKKVEDNTKNIRNLDNQTREGLAKAETKANSLIKEHTALNSKILETRNKVDQYTLRLEELYTKLEAINAKFQELQELDIGGMRQELQTAGQYINKYPRPITKISIHSESSMQEFLPDEGGKVLIGQLPIEDNIINGTRDNHVVYISGKIIQKGYDWLFTGYNKPMIIRFEEEEGALIINFSDIFESRGVISSVQIGQLISKSSLYSTPSITLITSELQKKGPGTYSLKIYPYKFREDSLEFDFDTFRSSSPGERFFNIVAFGYKKNE